MSNGMRAHDKQLTIYTTRDIWKVFKIALLNARAILREFLNISRVVKPTGRKQKKCINMSFNSFVCVL